MIWSAASQTVRHRELREALNAQERRVQPQSSQCPQPPGPRRSENPFKGLVCPARCCAVGGGAARGSAGECEVEVRGFRVRPDHLIDLDPDHPGVVGRAGWREGSVPHDSAVPAGRVEADGTGVRRGRSAGSKAAGQGSALDRIRTCNLLIRTDRPLPSAGGRQRSSEVRRCAPPTSGVRAGCSTRCSTSGGLHDQWRVRRVPGRHGLVLLCARRFIFGSDPHAAAKFAKEQLLRQPTPECHETRRAWFPCSSSVTRSTRSCKQTTSPKRPTRGARRTPSDPAASARAARRSAVSKRP